MIDTHAHIFGDKFEDIDTVVEDLTLAGVQKVIMPNIDAESVPDMLQVAQQYPAICYPAIGLHPTSVDENFEKELSEVLSWLEKERFIAIGEIGTDLYWEKKYWEHQKEAFTIQCDIALAQSLPIIIHCRSSIEETITMLERKANPALRGVFHCFTGTVEQAERIAALGFYLGIGGVVTFKNSTLDQVIEKIGGERLMLETDSPYLAPVPNRGKRNTPSYLPYICEKISGILGISNKEVETLTTTNARRLFDFW